MFATYFTLCDLLHKKLVFSSYHWRYYGLQMNGFYNTFPLIEIVIFETKILICKSVIQASFHC